MSEAVAQSDSERSLEELADDIANNDVYSEPVRRMARIVRDAKREGRT